jgi:hypothetical protein
MLVFYAFETFGGRRQVAFPSVVCPFCGLKMLMVDLATFIPTPSVTPVVVAKPSTAIVVFDTCFQLEINNTVNYLCRFLCV